MPTRAVSSPAKPKISAPKPAVASKAAPARKTAKPRARSNGHRAISSEERQRFIAEAAYFRAERRGFGRGSEMNDWLEAEAEIDALIDSSRTD